MRSYGSRGSPKRLLPVVQVPPGLFRSVSLLGGDPSAALTSSRLGDANRARSTHQRSARPRVFTRPSGLARGVPSEPVGTLRVGESRVAFDVVAPQVGNGNLRLSDSETAELVELLADLVVVLQEQLPRGVQLLDLELELGRVELTDVAPRGAQSASRSSRRRGAAGATSQEGARRALGGAK